MPRRRSRAWLTTPDGPRLASGTDLARLNRHGALRLDLTANSPILADDVHMLAKLLAETDAEQAAQRSPEGASSATNPTTHA